MLGPPELSLNPLWAGGLFISQIKFRHFSPRHGEQLVLIFAQIEVTRISIETMHSKRKPPIRQARIKPRLSEQEDVMEAWLSHERQSEGFELWAGFGQMSQSNQKAAQLWWCDRTSPMTQPVSASISLNVV